MTKISWQSGYYSFKNLDRPVIVKKIALIRNGLIAFGGAERLMIEEASYLSKQGYKVYIIVFEFNENNFLDIKYKIKNVEIIKLNKAKIDILNFYKLQKTLLKLKVDLIIAHESGHEYLIPLPWFWNKKLVLHMHGTFIWLFDDHLVNSFLFKNKVKKLRYRLPGHKEYIKFNKLNLLQRVYIEYNALKDYFGTRSCDEILTLTNFVKEEIKEIYNKDAKVFYGGFNPDEFRLIPNKQNKLFDKYKKYNLENKKIIITVNRLDKRKRFDLLLETMNYLVNEKNNKDIILFIIGDGEYKTKIAEKIKKLSLDNCVILTGFVTEEELNMFYNLADMLIYQAWCAFGLSAIEALSLNKKILCAEDALVWEAIIQYKNVDIFKINHKELGDKILNLFDRNIHIPKREIIEKLSWENYFKNIEKEIIRGSVYDNICSSKDVM